MRNILLNSVIKGIFEEIPVFLHSFLLRLGFVELISKLLYIVSKCILINTLPQRDFPGRFLGDLYFSNKNSQDRRVVTDPRVWSNRMNMINMVLRWRYVVLSMEQSRNNYVINVCFTYNTYLLMTFWLLLLRKINIAALWRTWHIIVSGQIVALLLSLCMTNWLRKINGDEADVTLVQTRKSQSLY